MKNLLIIFGFISFVLLALVSGTAQEIELTETIGNIELEINENGIVTVTQNMDLLAHEAIYQADITIPKSKFVEISDKSIDRFKSEICSRKSLVGFPNPLEGVRTPPAKSYPNEPAGGGNGR